MHFETTSDLLKIEQGGNRKKILKVVGWRDEAKTSGRMRDLKNPILDPSVGRHKKTVLFC